MSIYIYITRSYNFIFYIILLLEELSVVSSIASKSFVVMFSGLPVFVISTTPVKCFVTHYVVINSSKVSKTKTCFILLKRQIKVFLRVFVILNTALKHVCS